MSRRISRGLSTWAAGLLSFHLAIAGCGHDDRGDVDLGALVDAGGGASPQLTETQLEVSVEFFVDRTTNGNAGNSTLRVTTHDGTTPVRTDIWLYTLAGGRLKELDNFTAPTNRKSSRLMLPATLGGVPSGLAPADDGRVNGLMTGGARGSLVQGAFVSAIDGTVLVTLPARPSVPIVVVAGIEDQRYAGAAVLLPDGTPGIVPAGIGVPETHDRFSYERDVAPILAANCNIGCHNPTGPFDAARYLMDTQDHLVNNNFGLAEKTDDCNTMFPSAPNQRAACIRDITAAQFMVEPGAPAISGLLLRSRPDEARGTSPLGLVWYGGGATKVRYNPDYGDRRMPSTTISTTRAAWTNAPTYFDMRPKDFQVLYDWVAQGALP
jgi:hypothetical protein